MHMDLEEIRNWDRQNSSKEEEWPGKLRAQSRALKVMVAEMIAVCFELQPALPCAPFSILFLTKRPHPVE